MKQPTDDSRPIHHSPIFWLGILLCLAAIAIYLWSDDLSWRPEPRARWERRRSRDGCRARRDADTIWAVQAEVERSSCPPFSSNL